MRKLLLLLLLLPATIHAQVYADYDMGVAVQQFQTNSPLISLHFGYQFNNVLDPNGVAMVEYDQRALTHGVSPVYFGGRAGYGVNTGAYTTVSAWGGYYFTLLSGETETLNHWTPGYGISFLFKNFTIEASKVEFYNFSIGCHYLFN